MNPSRSQPKTSHAVEIAFSDRWQIYRRLQELGIPCRCKTNEPLIVEINNVTCAVQLWSVARELMVPRPELLSWLERCWLVTASSPKSQ
ncbi:Asr1405/Asl0597 family protein [Lyngbya aestuarii]|uniref:Asr1405/Asl0597 family protein n=1 Tax=Lyngbya aestuarii TaxID=118322 RepID=UPI00403D8F17